MDSTKFIFENNIPVYKSPEMPESERDVFSLHGDAQHETPHSTHSGEPPEAAAENPLAAPFSSPVGTPVDLPPELLTSGDAPEGENREEETDEKSRGGLLKIINAAASLTLCAATILFCLSGVISAVGKYSASDAQALMLSELSAGSATVLPKVETEQSEPPAEVPPADTSEPSPEPSESYPVASRDLSAGADSIFTLNNQTSFTPDCAALLKVGNKNRTPAEIYAEYGSDAPVVLIVHTHGTESYSDGGDTYTKSDSFRSENTEENVVAVGTVMTNVFKAAGINTIHCTEMFDTPSYRDSYSRSFAAVQEYLKENPSISYVFDVHRDAIIKDDLTKIRTFCAWNGETTAQAMLVVGTNEGGANHEKWEDNLAFALSIQEKLFSLSDTLPRKVNLRSAAFNQGLSSGGLLLEIGSCGNTLAEAKRCGALCAVAISDVILGRSCNLSAGDFSE